MIVVAILLVILAVTVPAHLIITVLITERELRRKR